MRGNTITTSDVPAARTLGQVLDAAQGAQQQLAEVSRQLDQAAAQAVLADALPIIRLVEAAQHHMAAVRLLVEGQVSRL